MRVFANRPGGKVFSLEFWLLVLPSPPLGEEEVDEVCQQVGLKTLAPSGAPGINPAMISRQEKLSGGRRWGGFM